MYVVNNSAIFKETEIAVEVCHVYGGDRISLIFDSDSYVSVSQDIVTVEVDSWAVQE